MHATLLRRNRIAKPAGGAELPDENAASGTDIVRAVEILALDIDLTLGPLLQVGGERPVFAGEEGPLEGRGVHDQLPSNTGVRFSTNARYARSKSSPCMHCACILAS